MDHSRWRLQAGTAPVKLSLLLASLQNANIPRITKTELAQFMKIKREKRILCGFDLVFFDLLFNLFRLNAMNDTNYINDHSS